MKRIVVSLTGMLLGTLIVVPCASEPAADKTSTANVSDSNNPPEPDTEHARREWALGCAAVLTERNHDGHTLLGGCPVNEGTKAAKKRLLSDDWGIDSREKLLETLQWIEAGGHRAKFEAVGRIAASLDDSRFQTLLGEERDPEIGNKLRVARQYYEPLGRKSLYGWDYSRAICLCRWAYVVGYLNEKEAWERIMSFALVLQKTFDSWEDLGRNYLIGRQFWSLRETRDSGWRCEDAYQRLLDMQSSPWNRYPWRMKLRDGDDEGPPTQEKRQEEGPKDRQQRTGRVATGNGSGKEGTGNG